MFKLHGDSPWVYFVEVQLDNIAWMLKNQKRYLADATSSDWLFGWWFDGAPHSQHESAEL
jgi:hypothetical protein